MGRREVDGELATENGSARLPTHEIAEGVEFRVERSDSGAWNCRGQESLRLPAGFSLRIRRRGGVDG
jgi:hypothetical protein